MFGEGGNNRADLIEWMFEDCTIVTSAVQEEDSKLVKPISQMVCFIPDAILGTCQRMFVTSDQFKLSEEEIEQKIEENKEKDEPEEIKYFFIKYSPGIIFSGGVPAFDIDFIKTSENKEETENIENEDTKYISTAQVLQGTIATFYNALRKIALVGLLSVLVYIGIRIVLTSTSAKDKAKYKSMLKDWLVAFCILFTMHYIMSITITIVDSITEILRASTMGASGEDVLMTTIRNKIANAETWSSVIVEVVLYFVLTVYTIIFTVQYLRRTIYLAFLTVIAPLITFTYPLDKIKDKKSQAFDMWIKDYIFFSLLQLVHLLLYYILVGSSLNLSVQGNWIFAIVAIGFLVPAEKIIKKMFGFEKSKTIGALAAGATGALVMNVMNKLKGKGKKGASSGKSEGTTENTNKVRMVSNDVVSTIRQGMNQSGINGNAGGKNTSPKSKKNKHPYIKGAAAVAQRYSGPAIKSIGKGALGAFLGTSGAILGIAKGVADGDLGGAFSGAMAGGATGIGLGNAGVEFVSNFGENTKKSLENIQDTYNEGAYGTEYAQSIKMVRAFKQTKEYRDLKDEFGDRLTDEKLIEIINATKK